MIHSIQLSSKRVLCAKAIRDTTTCERSASAIYARWLQGKRLEDLRRILILACTRLENRNKILTTPLHMCAQQGVFQVQI
jgi:hypothetical protein